MKILIILGNPSLKRKSFCEALAEEYKAGAIQSGHEVHLYKISEKKFDPILHEGFHEDQVIESDIIEAQQKIRWADHIVFIYPLWQFMIPSLLKGFLERALSKGFAYDLKEDMQKKLLAGKTARLIQTMGMPEFFYRLVYFAHGAKAFCSMLKFCRIKPRITYLGMVEFEPCRTRYLDKIRTHGTKGK